MGQAVVHPAKKIWESIAAGVVTVPVTGVGVLGRAVASARAAVCLPLPRSCFQGSSESSGPCFALSEQHCVKPASDAVSHGNALGKHQCAVAQEAAGCFLSVWFCLPSESKKVTDLKGGTKSAFIPSNLR